MDLDSFDLPKVKEKEESAFTVPDLSLNKHISFGPIKSSNDSSEKKMIGTMVEDRREETKYTLEKPPKVNKSPYSIASFIKKSLHTNSVGKALDFDFKKPSLFGSKSNGNASM